MKLLYAIFFLLVTTKGICQLRCADAINGFEPDPYELLNDSISNFATAKQIDQLIKEQMLLFSLNFNLQTQEINDLQLLYEKELALFDGNEPLEPELIKQLEHFFEKNLKVIVNPKYLNIEHNLTIKCVFSTGVKKE
ncbi:MAG: hypothetical protein ACFB2Y_14810 [Fulvivirga sp.]